jgi:hypothetical protein
VPALGEATLPPKSIGVLAPAVAEVSFNTDPMEFKKAAVDAYNAGTARYYIKARILTPTGITSRTGLTPTFFMCIGVRSQSLAIA